MNTSTDTFPQRAQVWHGAILATIAHAIWVTAHPLLSYELSWDGINYNRQDSEGTRGTITFTENHLVAVFRDDNSPRTPWNSGQQYDSSPFFNGVPPDLLSLANDEALQYVLEDYDDHIEPIITSAFWSNNEYVVAAEPWPNVFTHGAHLIKIELMDTELAILEWKNQYQWSDREVSLLRTLFTRKIAMPNIPIVLEDAERDILISQGIEGIDESRELLAAINIFIP